MPREAQAHGTWWGTPGGSFTYRLPRPFSPPNVRVITAKIWRRRHRRNSASGHAEATLLRS
jgi:hypothetical protein